MNDDDNIDRKFSEIIGGIEWNTPLWPTDKSNDDKRVAFADAMDQRSEGRPLAIRQHGRLDGQRVLTATILARIVNEMRIVSVSGDLHCESSMVEPLRDAAGDGNYTVVDLRRVTNFDELFINELFFFLKRCKKNNSGVVVVAKGNVARRLQRYGVHVVAKMVSDYDSAVGLSRE